MSARVPSALTCPVVLSTLAKAAPVRQDEGRGHLNTRETGAVSDALPLPYMRAG